MTLGAALRDVVFVRFRRELVHANDVGMTADALIDVRGHVDHVAGARHQRHEPIGFGFSALRIGRLPEVNPEMQRAGMQLVLGEHVLER